MFSRSYCTFTRIPVQSKGSAKEIFSFVGVFANYSHTLYISVSYSSCRGEWRITPPTVDKLIRTTSATLHCYLLLWTMSHKVPPINYLVTADPGIFFWILIRYIRFGPEVFFARGILLAKAGDPWVHFLMNWSWRRTRPEWNFIAKTCYIYREEKRRRWDTTCSRVLWCCSYETVSNLRYLKKTVVRQFFHYLISRERLGAFTTNSNILRRNCHHSGVRTQLVSEDLQRATTKSWNVKKIH